MDFHQPVAETAEQSVLREKAVTQVTGSLSRNHKSSYHASRTARGVDSADHGLARAEA
jgi:hypothetical protein